MGASEIARAVYAGAQSGLSGHLGSLTLDEALSSAGGYRSILGVLKHAGGWAHVYRSYAFDPEPKHWAQTSWPRGLRDVVDATKDYLEEVIAWIGRAASEWDRDLAATPDEAFDELRPVHWGQRMPLMTIVMIAANHLTYHAGELNMLLSIARGEAWEYTEEVEENHIWTAGHRVRAMWMSDEQAKAHEEYLAKRDAELHG